MTTDRAGTLAVLVVDDNPGDRDLVAAYLEGAPGEYEISFAPSLTSAVEIFSEAAFDAVLLDLGLPDSQGLETFRRFRAAAPDVPVVVMTGHDDDAVGIEAVQGGAQDYLIKGRTGSEDLNRSLRYAVGRHEASVRVSHLTQVLRAIRKVNQLIVREKDPGALIQKTCELLIETRGYRGAWIALGDSQVAPAALAQAGWGDRFQPFARQLQEGEWPGCRETSSAAADGLAFLDPVDVCAGCPLSEGYGHGVAAAVALRHDGDDLGTLCVSFPRNVAVDDDERALLLEVAGDIAFAVHNIEAERLRIDSETRLKSAVFGGHVGLWEWDLRTKDVFFSDEWKAQIGHSADEIADQYSEWERRIHPDDLQPTLEKIEQTLEAPEHPYEVEFRLRHKDGGYRHILARGRVRLGQDGEPARMFGSHVDISELKTAELGLAQNERLLRDITDNMYDMVALTDVEGRFIYASPSHRQLGFEPDRLLGRNILDQVHGDDRGRINKKFEELRHSGDSIKTEVLGIRADGQRVWLESIAKVIREKGAPRGMIVSTRDITDRKQAVQQMEASEKRFRMLFENSMAAIMIADDEGRYVDVNEAACKMFGHDRRTLLSMREPDLVSAAPGSAGAPLQEAGRDPTDHGEFTFTRADGEERVALWSAAEITEGQYASVLRDVTEIKRYEEKLCEEKLRAQRYLDVAAVVLLGLDTDGKISLVNPRGCEVLGVARPEDLLGEDWFRFVPGDSRDEVREIHRENMSRDAEFHERVEGEVLMSSGEVKTVVWHNAVVRDAHGRIVGSLSSGEDVTERRALEVQLALSDRLSSVGMLAAGVAHEINNPLAYVLYNLESLIDDLPDLLRTVRGVQARLAGAAGSDRDLGEAADMMNPAMLDDIVTRFKDAMGGAHRIRDIARGLGTFSRVESDQLVPVNLMHVIEVAVNMAYNEIKYRARLVKDYGKIPAIMASEGRLSQVFLNLLINAAHAVDDGNVDDNEIRVRTWAEDESVFAEIRDTGSGIEQATLGRLFEPFFTTKEIGVGSGLGLAISKNIIESYGGTIAVQSEVGEGTSFTICLPVRSGEPGPIVAAADAGTDPGARGRVLVVDDEARIRTAIVRMLSDHETVQAASGAAARRLLESDQSFDVILCDMMMSDVSGMDLHQWLVANHPFLARQLIFITGGAFTPRVRDYLSKVDNVRLEKPFDVSKLKKILSEMIRSARSSKRGE